MLLCLHTFWGLAPRIIPGLEGKLFRASHSSLLCGSIDAEFPLSIVKLTLYAILMFFIRKNAVITALKIGTRFKGELSVTRVLKTKKDLSS